MEPLASKIRPTTLQEFIGQEHLMGVGKPLRVAIEQKHLLSFILWGPPGSGKTTLARLYARAMDAAYYELSAVSAGKDDIRKILDSQNKGQHKILFIDEIHRFNKAQQDFFLPYVELGNITLIGATTENPSFEIIAPLLSRCRVFIIQSLSAEDMKKIMARTNYIIPEDAQEWLIAMANGDARQAISTLENTIKLYNEITVETLQKQLQNSLLRYDKKAEEHYNTISAFIKSMRASQVDSALYYLARMIEGGEDPKFIARRMVIFASEDIGLEDSQALAIAHAVFKAVEIIGYPECAINLAHGTCYLASAPKSKKSYYAYNEAVDDVKKYGNLPIPLTVRNAVTPLMKDIGYGKGYQKYTKDSFLPEKLIHKKYFRE
jgi:putative ATPase